MQIKAVATFLTIFRAHINISFILKVKILVLIKRSYRSPQLHWLMNVVWLSYFKHVVQSLLNTFLLISILGATPNHIPLKYIGVLIRKYSLRFKIKFVFGHKLRYEIKVSFGEILSNFTKRARMLP
jgi:hypothetical protein